MSPDELRITGLSAVQLLKELAHGKLTSVAVTSAFLHRAALATQLLNCTLEYFPNAALQRAQELDDYYRLEGKVIGPLHGLPISLKDQFRIKVCATRCV